MPIIRKIGLIFVYNLRLLPRFVLGVRLIVADNCRMKQEDFCMQNVHTDNFIVPGMPRLNKAYDTLGMFVCVCVYAVFCVCDVCVCTISITLTRNRQIG